MTAELEKMIRDIHATLCPVSGPATKPYNQSADLAFRGHCAVLNLHPGVLRTESREQWLVDARTVICRKMRHEGFTMTDIAHTMNRTHGAVWHMLKRFRHQGQCKEIQRLWDKINETN